MKHQYALRGVLIFIPLLYLISFLFVFLPQREAEAIPAFARKYDLRCNACHTREPRLNPFGERFLENGYQIPGTEDGGVTGKINLGPVSVDPTRFIIAVRLRGQVVEYFKYTDIPVTNEEGEKEELEDQINLATPDIVNLFFAGTLAKNVSFFFELEGNARLEETGFERAFFLIDNIGLPGLASVRIGRFDPSAYFSYPTHRQMLGPIQPLVDEELPLPAGLLRAPLVPNAWALKFFGLFDGEGNGLLPLRPSLFNSPAEIGIDVHGRPFGRFFLYQAGIVHGTAAGVEDFNKNKDYYFMGRVDVGGSNFFSASASAFYYKANESIRLPQPPLPPPTPGAYTDLTRWGLGANVRWKMVDIYGAYVKDKIDDISPMPAMLQANFDDDAWGATVEVDVLAREWLVLSARYDKMDAGGLVAVKANSSALGLQAKFYPVDNFGVFVRNDINLEDDGTGPLQRTRNSFLVGTDFAF